MEGGAEGSEGAREGSRPRSRARRLAFGAASWLALRADGNVLVDSPRFAAPLAARIRELGGVRLMFLTHRDDVADHARWAEALGCARVLHALRFEWVLPGHGRPWRAHSAEIARREVLALARAMREGERAR